jgi:hypothetical protein
VVFEGETETESKGTDEGDEQELVVEEEDGDCVVDFKWVSVSAIVSAGDEGIDTDVLLQKRFADGENTGEFDTATEHDIVFLFSFRVVFVLVF